MKSLQLKMMILICKYCI